MAEGLDAVQVLRREARQAVMAECHKNPAAKLLRSMPFFGPLRAAVLIARVQTPHRFRTKRQFWTYCGLGLETRSSADYVEKDGQILRRRKPIYIRGLNWNYSHPPFPPSHMTDLEVVLRIPVCPRTRNNGRLA